MLNSSITPDILDDLEDEAIEDILGTVSEEEIISKKLESKPETEQVLLKLQAEFLKVRGDRNKEEKIMQEMFHSLSQYARSLTLAKIKNKFHLIPSEVSRVAIRAASKLLEMYYKKEGFEVKESFAGYVKWKIIEELYGDAEEEKHLSLNSLVPAYNSRGGAELGDLQGTLGIEGRSYIASGFDFESNPENLYDRSQEVLDNVLDIIRGTQITLFDNPYSYMSYMKLLNGLYLFFKYGNKIKNEFMENATNREEELYEATLLGIYEFLKE